MKGVLVLAHGSRRKETEETLGIIIDMLKGEFAQNHELIEIEKAFLQFSDHNLHSGLKTLAEKGIDEILVVPYFLFEGVHIIEDIPDEIAEFTRLYPNTRVRLTKPLGADSRLALILKDRIMEMV